MLGDAAGQEVAERRFDEGRKPVPALFGCRQEFFQLRRDDLVDQFLVDASRLVDVFGRDGVARRHAPRCTGVRAGVDDADGMNADRRGTAPVLRLDRRLRRIGESIADGRTPRALDDRPKARGGAILVRTWREKSYTVTVSDKGYVLEGVSYRSLSEVAPRLEHCSEIGTSRCLGLSSADLFSVRDRHRATPAYTRLGAGRTRLATQGRGGSHDRSHLPREELSRLFNPWTEC
jgi:hypothetical protein